jgi:hypothetical protein
MAVQYFGLSNPEAFEQLKSSPNMSVHFGVIKSKAAGAKFWDDSLSAATKQAEALGSCALVVQRGFFEAKKYQKHYRYALYTFFRANQPSRIDGRNSKIFFV